jgi:type I restriction enzyme S subunit
MSEATSTQGIPDGWSIRAVRDLGEVIAGKALAATAPGRMRPYLRTKNVFDGRILVDDVLSMPMTEEQFETFRLRHGDVLLNEGQSLELVGRCAIYADDYPVSCAIQNALLRFRARPNVSALFASYVFRHCQHTGVFARIALQTTSVAHLGVTRFADLKLPWPQTETEQGTIATALSDVDALIAGLERLIAKKRDIKQAAMQQLLTGQTRLPGFSGEWVPRPLGALGATYGGLIGKSKANFGHGPARYVPFVNVMANIRIDCGALEPVDVASTENQNRVLSGDLLFNGSSETPEEVALCALMTESVEDLYLNSFCFGFRLKQGAEASGLFLTYLMRSQMGRELMKSLAQGSTRYNLSKSALLQATLVLPDLEEQTAIATVLSDMDADLAAIESRLAKARVIKQGMMQELLTGRTRLVEHS